MPVNKIHVFQTLEHTPSLDSSTVEQLTVVVDSVRVTKMLEQVETFDPELKHLMGLSNLALESVCRRDFHRSRCVKSSSIRRDHLFQHAQYERRFGEILLVHAKIATIEIESKQHRRSVGTRRASHRRCKTWRSADLDAIVASFRSINNVPCFKLVTFYTATRLPAQAR